MIACPGSFYFLLYTFCLSFLFSSFLELTKTCLVFSCLCPVFLCILKRGEERKGGEKNKSFQRPYDRSRNIWFIGLNFFFPIFLLPVHFSGLESLFIVFSFFLQKFSLGFYVCCFVLCLAFLFH
ncbi:hypothetical protein HOY82DRAFT_271101 [Tuber indicum]|nr:hypothetical protein HOY82DRAFT_271101 [Tuber indicum]